jgi:hypothetical protein
LVTGVDEAARVALPRTQRVPFGLACECLDEQLDGEIGWTKD